jgi:glycosyltransferase involved in cell wall biosynthesis
MSGGQQGPAGEHEPTIAVVIPAYRASATLGRALASVRSQSLLPNRILVVDDGSEEDLAGCLGSELTGIELIRRANGGPAAARNEGLERAGTELVAFLDADDVWSDDALELLREPFLAASHPVDAVQARLVDVWPPESGLPSLSAPRRSFNVGAALFRRGVVQGIGGFDPALRSGEDFDLWARLRSAGARVLTLEAAVLHYVRRPLELGIATGSLHAERLHSLKRLLDRERRAQQSQ